MKCSNCRIEISGALDLNRDPSAEALQHLDGCLECRKFRRKVTDIDKVLKIPNGPQSDFPQNLHGRIIDELKQRDRVRTKATTIYLRSVIAAAALILILFGATLLFRPDVRAPTHASNAGTPQPNTARELLLSRGYSPQLLVDTDVRMSSRLGDEIEFLKHDVNQAAVFCDSFFGTRLLSMNQ